MSVSWKLPALPTALPAQGPCGINQSPTEELKPRGGSRRAQREPDAVPTTVSSMLSSSSATNTTTSTSLRDALPAASQRQGTRSAAGGMAESRELGLGPAGSWSSGLKVSYNL